MQCFDTTTATSIVATIIALSTVATAEDLSHSELKQICREGMRDHTLPYAPVNIKITPTFVSDNLHCVFQPIGAPEPSDPLQVLRSTQVAIEALRDFSDESDRRKRFWSPHLNTGDRKVHESLMAVQNSDRDQEEQLKQAKATSKEVQEIFEEALRKYAGQNGLKSTKLATMPFMVGFNVATEPNDASVEVMLRVDYYILKKKGVSDRDINSNSHSHMWHRMDKPRTRNYGNYLYRLKLSDGTVTAFNQDRKIEIDTRMEGKIATFRWNDITVGLSDER